MPKIINNKLDLNFFLRDSFNFFFQLFLIAEMRVVQTLQDILSLSWAADNMFINQMSEEIV